MNVTRTIEKTVSKVDPCGAIGRAVAHDTRGPRFKSYTSAEKQINPLIAVLRKDKKKESG